MPFSAIRQDFWQLLAVATLSLGVWYLHWRWSESLNPDAMFFSIAIALAETLAYFGLVLFFFDIWAVKDTQQKPPPKMRSDGHLTPEYGMISVDVFIATHDENPDIVKLTIADATQLRKPSNTKLIVHLLDDGNRTEMRDVAHALGALYISRGNNIGFKAGNLKNALAQSTGDFVVICDADTRIFPYFLVNTMGYFCDKHVAWVQTPHWFYDIPAGQPLEEVLSKTAGPLGRITGHLVTRILGPIRLEEDPFSSDPGLFFDIIQRRRNRHNASFCCGAASIHRREAVMAAAIT